MSAKTFAANCVAIGAIAASSISTSSAGEKLYYFRADGGVSADAHGLPDDLNKPEALKWSAELPVGQSSPLVSQGKVFVTGFDGDQKKLVTIAFDELSGKELWRKAIQVERIEEYHPQTGTGAPATPACDGKHVYIFFGSYGLLCYDLDGNLVWEHRIGPFRDEYGAGSSPILLDDKIILNQDHDVNSFVAAFDRASGKELWRTPRPDAVRSYSTPVIWKHDGRKEILVAGALELAAYDPADGQKLWWTYGLARIVIPMPMADGKRIYMASWAPGGDASSRISLEPWDEAVGKWDANKDGELSRTEIKDPNVLDRFFRMDLDQNGRLNETEWNRHAEVFRRAQNALLAIEPSKDRGQLPEEDVVWKYPRGAPYVSSPLFDGEAIWMVKDGGIVTKIEAATGKRLAEERLAGPGSYYASPVAGDGKVYFCSERGVVSILAAKGDWQILASRDFHQRIDATPAIDGERFFLRTETKLYCFGGGR